MANRKFSKSSQANGKHSLRRFRRYLMHRDTILATVAVLLFMWLLHFIPINLHVLSPGDTAAEDLDFNDLAYSRSKGTEVGSESEPYQSENRWLSGDTNIVLVNVGDTSRSGIASIIEHLVASQPKVIGVDIVFNEHIIDSADSRLAQLFSLHPNIIHCHRLVHENDNWRRVGGFQSQAHQTGYANFISNGPPGVIRSFAPFEDVRKEHDTSFTAAVLRLYNPQAYDRLLKRKHPLYINYTRAEGEYKCLQKEEIVSRAKELKNRIVLVGTMGRHAHDVFNIEDKHFTPLNHRIAGKSLPDMYGVTIHANILSMMLEENYIRVVPAFLNLAITFLFTWLFMALYMKFFTDHEQLKWFHLRARLMQVSFAVIFVFLSIVLLKEFRLRLNISQVLVAVALGVDILYFYEALAYKLHKRFGWRTIFETQH